MTLLEALQRKKATFLKKMKESEGLKRKLYLKKYIYYTNKINKLTIEEAEREVKFFGNRKRGV